MTQPRREADVIIGRDVWLGARVIVLAGVTIGDGCVIGAGSVVTRSLPPNSIAVGAPARVVGERT
jgi:acetyltransferase-like isoleucine patch superfamily enzyme